MGLCDVEDFLGHRWTAQLFSDAELAKDKIQDVIARRGAGHGVEGSESFVKVKENYLVGNGCGV
jgi:hypothetical protein